MVDPVVPDTTTSAATPLAEQASDWLMQRLIGRRRGDLDDASTPQLGEHLRALDRLLARERNKGVARHWSYDLNRHIALKSVRDIVAEHIDNRRHRRVLTRRQD